MTNTKKEVSICLVYTYVRVSQVWPQERLRRTKFIILAGPRNRRQGTPHRATWESSRVVRRQKIAVREKSLGQSLYWGSHRKGKAGQGKQLITA